MPVIPMAASRPMPMLVSSNILPMADETPANAGQSLCEAIAEIELSVSVVMFLFVTMPLTMCAAANSRLFLLTLYSMTTIADAYSADRPVLFKFMILRAASTTLRYWVLPSSAWKAAICSIVVPGV